MNSIKRGFSYVRRAPYQATAVVVVMTLSFFISSLIIVTMYGSSRLLKVFETRPQIIAFLRVDISAQDMNKIFEVIKNDQRVKTADLVTKEKAYEFYKEITKDNPLSAEFVSPSSLPPSVEFSVKDIGFAEDMIEELQKNDFVDSVGFTASVGGESQLTKSIQRLEWISQTIRYVGLISVAVLFSVSFVVLLVVMSMRVSMRKVEIENMSLLGATNIFITLPVLVESFVYSALGAFFGWLGSLVLIFYATPHLAPYFKDIEVLPKKINELLIFMGAVLGSELIAALAIAILGAFLAVSRNLRSK